MRDINRIVRNKYIIAAAIICLITVLLEVFVFNFSSFRCSGRDAVQIAGEAFADDSGSFTTDSFAINGDLRNIYADADVEGGKRAYVSVILTDEGDKYEYETAEFVLCSGLERSGYSNLYPFGKTDTVRVRVRAEEGATVHVRGVYANVHRPVDVKPVRVLVVFLILFLGYLIFTESFIHEVIFDSHCIWQRVVTLAVIVCILVMGVGIVKSDKLLLKNPWPHHLQYQELARSLSSGDVVLTEIEPDPGLLQAENPYDTIALQVEGIPYAMDYAYYNGHYYAYFGIVPELLFYLPFHLLTGGNLPNYLAILGFFVVFVFGVFWFVEGMIRRFAGRVPYYLYLLISIGVVFCASFVYLLQRPDIYNVPIMGAAAFSFAGMGLWLEALNTKRQWVKRTCLFLGSLMMALIAGCRPQMILLFVAALILFVIGRKSAAGGSSTDAAGGDSSGAAGGDSRGAAGGDSRGKIAAADLVCFLLPILLAAIPVCWYNYSRFGSIFDFGATYSLTSNDMNHRGFNIERLIRSLYSYLFQPPAMTTDFPFMVPPRITGDYMGKFLCEFTFGGVLVANAFMFSLWIALLKGLKGQNRTVRLLVAAFVVTGLVIAGFDANAAGVIYRYTCDYAPAFTMAAATLWLMMLDRDGTVMSYRLAARLFFLCLVAALGYSLFSFAASGSVVCLFNDNTELFFRIADYFKF